MADQEELPDFDDEAAPTAEVSDQAGESTGTSGGVIRASGFRDFLLREELMKAILECGFEHPSEVQHACIPQAVLGNDVLCQAKSGMGKTAVFVLACIQTIDTSKEALKALVICHTRELAWQVKAEFARLGKFMTALKVAAIYGGTPIANDKASLKKTIPHVLVGTPGRLVQLIKDKTLNLDALSHFIVDECDRCIENLELRRDVQQIFIRTPKTKQVMMFSATITPETRMICNKFMQGPHEITVESESKLRLHGLLQYAVVLDENQKTKKLVDLLDLLEFNQVVVFVSSVQRSLALDHLLREQNFPSMTLHPLPEGFEHKASPGNNVQGGRIERLQAFKDGRSRILVVTDVFGRGIDVESVNIVINYDMPQDSNMYLHRVGRAGRFGTKGLAISFVCGDTEKQTMQEVQSRFEVKIGPPPAKIDTTSYLNS